VGTIYGDGLDIDGTADFSSTVGIHGALNMNNANINGVGAIHIADPGDQEGIIWDGSQAKIFVSPFDSGNSDGYLRIINDTGIVFEVPEDSERVFIDSSGNVGIGTTGPGGMLNTGSGITPDSDGTHLDIRSANNEAVLNLRTNQDADGAHLGGIYFTRDGGQGDVHRQVAGIQARQYGTGSLAGGELWFFTKPSGTGIGGDVDNARMVIDRNGSVGIGTTSPSKKLHVNGDVQIETNLYMTDGTISDANNVETNVIYDPEDGTLQVSDTLYVTGNIWVGSSVIYDNENLYLDIDNNNNGSNYLIVRNGGDSEVLRVNESGDLRIGAGRYIDDDTSFGGTADDWIRLNGYIELHSNTDSYGIVLRDKDTSNYLGITQVGGASYFADTTSYSNYFLKGDGANVTIRGDLTVSGGDINGRSISTFSTVVWKNSPADLIFTCDNTWRDYDATSITSANTRVVILGFRPVGGRWLTILTRRNGSTESYEGVFSHEEYDGAQSDGAMIIQGTDSGQVFEYKCQIEGAIGSDEIKLVGYIEYATGADLAEVYYTDEGEEVEAGDVVVTGSSGERVRRSDRPYQKEVIGVISTKPGLVIGEEPDGVDIDVDRIAIVALAGRVPVKVSTENGPIEVGDWLTTSSKPGVAMKATGPGSVIGKALEAYNNPDPNAVEQILMFVSLSWYGGEAFEGSSAGSGSDSQLANVIDVSNAPQDQPSLFIDSFGNLGVGVASPSYKLEVAGAVKADGFIATSTKERKKDIKFLRDEEYEEILEKIASTSVATYVYNRGTNTEPGRTNTELVSHATSRRLGLIAEGAPEEILSEDGKGIDLYKMNSFLWAGLKAQQKEIKELRALLENSEMVGLGNEEVLGTTDLDLNSDGTAGAQIDVDHSSGIQGVVEELGEFVGKLSAGLEKLGVSIKNGVIRAVKLVVSEIFAKKVVVEGDVKVGGKVVSQKEVAVVSNGLGEKNTEGSGGVFGRIKGWFTKVIKIKKNEIEAGETGDYAYTNETKLDRYVGQLPGATEEEVNLVTYGRQAVRPEISASGSAKLVNGEVWIGFAPSFSALIKQANLEIDCENKPSYDCEYNYKVIISPTSSAKFGLYVAKKKIDGFLVRGWPGESGTTFDWLVIVPVETQMDTDINTQMDTETNAQINTETAEEQSSSEEQNVTETTEEQGGTEEQNNTETEEQSNTGEQNNTTTDNTNNTETGDTGTDNTEVQNNSGTEEQESSEASSQTGTEPSSQTEPNSSEPGSQSAPESESSESSSETSTQPESTVSSDSSELESEPVSETSSESIESEPAPEPILDSSSELSSQEPALNNEM